MEISKMNYNDWLNYTFNHGVDFKNLWYLNNTDDDAPLYRNPNPIIAHLIRLFQNPELLLADYSIAQIDQGFWFIPGPCGYMRLLLSEHCSNTLKGDCIACIYTLYKKLFIPYLTPEGYTSPLMWWDSLSSYSVIENKELHKDRYLFSLIIDLLNKMNQDENKKMREYAKAGLELFTLIN